METVLMGASPDFGMLILRVTVGVFFAISGFHKLFVAERHQKLYRTLVANKIPYPMFNVWWVPAWEFGAGVLLVLGLGTVFQAAVLTIICVVAACCEAPEKVKKWEPHINCMDKVDCYLYLPEILYIGMMLAVIIGGPGMYSLDWWLLR